MGRGVRFKRGSGSGSESETSDTPVSEEVSLSENMAAKICECSRFWGGVNLRSMRVGVESQNAKCEALEVFF